MADGRGEQAEADGRHNVDEVATEGACGNVACTWCQTIFLEMKRVTSSLLREVVASIQNHVDGNVDAKNEGSRNYSENHEECDNSEVLASRSGKTNIKNLLVLSPCSLQDLSSAVEGSQKQAKY